MTKAFDRADERSSGLRDFSSACCKPPAPRSTDSARRATGIKLETRRFSSLASGTVLSSSLSKAPYVLAAVLLVPDIVSGFHGP
jgi:hypothetical protein